MYNTPILTPEDGVKQAIDISDGYSGVYGITANDLICDPKSDYWIEDVKNEDFIRKGPYNIYKGPFPNKEEIIMSCSKQAIKGVYSDIDELVFSHKGIVQAELRCEKEDILEKRITLSLRSQQKELGVVYRYHGISTINYYPFFRLVSAPEGCCYKTMACIVVFSLVIAVFSIFYLCADENIITILMTKISVGICFAMFSYFFCCQSCTKDGVRRLHTYNVIDMKTYKLVAEVYKLETVCCNQSFYRELICHREMTRSQLMGLFSLVMLSESTISAEPPKPYNPYA